MTRKSSFPPVAAASARVLILGSLPGEQSLAKAQYYGHPQNQFWRLMGEVTEVDLPSLDYAARLDSLLADRVALWDVLASALRSGSLDAAIRAHEANDLRGLVASLPDLRAVGFNGGTAARIGRKALTGLDLTLVDLPSSSPAYTLSFDRKREAWLALRSFL
ncbi:DNA-deoxyinosine glycosylase [Allosphingosinicella vermicomposti]|uniref:DNA-deoxyinosine glycosylase n=1 Tax=Allosphingosinicella vermicomposti TaxID=614671 RepID=UPI000D0EC126|nr:DNA-deoxyinosine glycosylase [Allosphingosinicella vermicomposti]